MKKTIITVTLAALICSGCNSAPTETAPVSQTTTAAQTTAAQTATAEQAAETTSAAVTETAEAETSESAADSVKKEKTAADKLREICPELADGYFVLDNITYARPTGGFFQIGSWQERPEIPNGQWIQAGDSLGGLTVDFACCQVKLDGDNTYVSCEAMKLSGEITLDGLLCVQPQEDPLGFLQKGDMVFYPYPESLGELPLIMYPYESGYINENGFDLNADTAVFYFGNRETKKLVTDTDFNRQIALPEFSAEFPEILGDVIGENEVYSVSLTFDELFIQQGMVPKTGRLFNYGHILRVNSAEAADLTVTP